MDDLRQGGAGGVPGQRGDETGEERTRLTTDRDQPDTVGTVRAGSSVAGQKTGGEEDADRRSSDSAPGNTWTGGPER